MSFLQLAQVDLGDKDALVSRDDFAQVARERVQVAQMGVRHPTAGLAHLANRGLNGAIG